MRLLTRLRGEDPWFGAGFRSATCRVPAGVPSETQSSTPAPGVLAEYASK